MSTATEPRIVGVTTLNARESKFQRGSLFVASVVPLIGFVAAIWSLWGRGLSGTDAGIAIGLYVFTGLGVSVGFHRLLTHKTFDAVRPVRTILAIAGSMSIEMSVIDWVATHRRHHAYSDKPGDPHSPHLDPAQGFRGVVKGLWYAHMGWLFQPERTSRERWAPDLLKDKTMLRINRLFPVFVVTSFALPFVLGYLITGTLWGAFTAFMWGGLARIFLLHHVTFSINSVCHYFGKRPYKTKEKSTNFWPLGILSFGESWHNNHHAFQNSAFLGLKWWQLDPGNWLLRGLKLFGLVRNLERPSRETIYARS